MEDAKSGPEGAKWVDLLCAKWVDLLAASCLGCIRHSRKRSHQAPLHKRTPRNSAAYRGIMMIMHSDAMSDGNLLAIETFGRFLRTPQAETESPPDVTHPTLNKSTGRAGDAPNRLTDTHPFSTREDNQDRPRSSGGFSTPRWP